MKPRFAFGLLALAVIGAMAYWQFFSPGATNKQAAGNAPGQTRQVPPPSVTVAKATGKTVPIEIRTIGTVQPIASVQIKSRVDGMLAKVSFNEGDIVKAGDPLFSIDPRSYEAQLKQAEANLLRDQAQLENARLDLKRNQTTASSGITSQKLLDQARTQVQTFEAAIKSDEAAIDVAKVQLSYTDIKAPITGRTGDMKVSEGNIVKANDTTALVTINQLRPIYVTFAVPEKQLPEIRARHNKAPLAVTLTDDRGVQHPETGTLTFIDNAIDTTTGTIQLKATFANDRDFLWPGQFMQVTLRVSRLENAVTVPSAAIQSGQNGPYVYVLRSDQTVELRPVKPGVVLASDTVVLDGVSIGETVVIDGHLRLSPNAKVIVRNPADNKS
ncbi:MAG: efflux RND transporter periplasmic adaptor subunit [Rhodospirillales bacterium]